MTLAPRDAWTLAALTLMWGVNWPIMKAGVRDMPPMTFRTLALVGALATLALAMRWQRQDWRVPRAARGELLRIAVFNGVLWLVLSIEAVRLLASGRAAILGYTMPIWTALLGLALYGEHPTRRLWLGVGAAALGVALLLAGEATAIAGRPLGALAMLGAAAGWGYGTHLMRRRRLVLPLTVLTFWVLAISCAVTLSLAVAFERDAWVRAPDAVEWGAIVYNALLAHSVCQLAWFRLATVLPPVASSLSVMMIPVVGLLSGMVLLGEVPSWRDWAALACILAALATVLLPARGPATAGSEN